MRRLLYLVPVALFAVLAALLYGRLHSPADEVPSVLLGTPAPSVRVPALDARLPGFGPDDLKGQVTLVNVFASWCVPCREEAPMLAELAQAHRVRLIGLIYKDKADAARAFLEEYGNPFARIGFDPDGRAGIEWGISKVPESFVIDAQGVIRGRFGPITPDSLAADILPAIEAAARQDNR